MKQKGFKTDVRTHLKFFVVCQQMHMNGKTITRVYEHTVFLVSFVKDKEDLDTRAVPNTIFQAPDIRY